MADSNKVVANYNATFNSIYANQYEPQVWKTLYDRYGDGLKVFDFLQLAGNVVGVANRDFHHFERGAYERLVKLADSGSGNGIDTGAGGADITFKADTTMYDSDNNPPLRVGDVIVIPASYQPAAVKKPRNYRVMSSTGSGNALTFTATPVLGDSGISGVTNSQISTAVPIGTELMVADTLYAAGTGQPTGKRYGLYRRSHKLGISKESKGIEGGQVALKQYQEDMKNGFSTLTNQAMLELEFELNKQIEYKMLLSEPDDNSSLVETSQFGGSTSINSGRGIYQWMDELAQELSYTSWDIDTFDSIKDLFLSQGVTSGNVLMGMGSNLNREVENSLLDYLKSYSGGTDLTSDVGKSMKAVGFQPREFYKNSFNFLLCEFVSFSNPNSLGASAYDFKDLGMIVPLKDVPVQMEKGAKAKYIPNLSYVHLNHNGENRQRVMATVAGMNGLGYQVTNQYDGQNIWALSECGVFMAAVNQNILVRKTT